MSLPWEATRRCSVLRGAALARTAARTAPLFPAAALLGALAAHQLVEVTALPSRGFILHQQRQVAIFKHLEPFFPFDGLQRLLAAVAGEIEANDADFVGAGIAP